uniref:Cysteine proteinase n=1 Tax=Lactuca sativa TaxID=4236 RepID=A0A9R1WMI1_LACSA|nr:hypothetical protein LSAT_V11C100011930 [Lactuca sativa]
MNTLILRSLTLVLAVGLVQGFEYNEKDLETEESMSNLYQRWRDHHNLQETTHAEKHKQFKAFKSNLQHVHKTNKMNKLYTLKLNQYAGMTNDEFMSKHTGFKSKRQMHHMLHQSQRNEVTNFMYADAVDVPPAVDWRKEAVTPVRTQGICGSCWAFSTVDSVEGINQIKTKKLVRLSPQQLIDCDIHGVNNRACDGGIMGDAFEYITKNGGITTEENYPYTGVNVTCNAAKAADHAVSIDGYENVPEENEDALLKAVAHQPVSVAVDAQSNDFQLYAKGVFTGECGTDVNHGVTAVGYGETDDGVKYWIIRTSWGESWGEKGYMRLLRGVPDKKGVCGVAVYGAYPIKKSDTNPKSSLNREEL